MIEDQHGGVQAAPGKDQRIPGEVDQLPQFLQAGGLALGQLQLHRSATVDLQELLLAGLQHRLLLFPAVRIRRRCEFGIAEEGDLAGLLVLHAVHDQLVVDHGFGQSGRAAFGFCQVADLASQIAADFFGGVLEHEPFVQKNRSGIPQHGVGGHDDLVTAQGHNRRSAERFAGNVSDGAGPAGIA